MARPLELAYAWGTPVVVSSVAVVVLTGLLARSGTAGWPVAALSCLALWAGFLVVVYLRTRAHLAVDGPVLTVRRYRSCRSIPGLAVIRVRQFLTPYGPCYRLTGRDADGTEFTQVVPTALLRRGHSTFFTWLLQYAPAAELDEGSKRTIEALRIRGLIE